MNQLPYRIVDSSTYCYALEDAEGNDICVIGRPFEKDREQLLRETLTWIVEAVNGRAALLAALQAERRKVDLTTTLLIEVLTSSGPVHIHDLSHATFDISKYDLVTEREEENHRTKIYVRLKPTPAQKSPG